MHSGLQLGGVPTNSGKQEHEGLPFVSLHCAFAPQGEGWQGFEGFSATSVAINLN